MYPWSSGWDGEVKEVGDSRSRCYDRSSSDLLYNLFLLTLTYRVK